MSSNTENLGLYIDDPATDGQQYFDIEKSIGNNFKAIDEQLGVHLKESTKAAALTHGTQVIQGGAVPAIAFPKVDGRTLINLLGDAGACDDVASWVPYFSSKLYIESGQLKFVLEGTTGGAYIENSFKLKTGARYVYIADMRNGNAVSGVGIRFLHNNLAYDTPLYTGTTLKPHFIKFTAANEDFIAYVHAYNSVAGQYGYADNVRFYEISLAEYEALDSMTAEQVASRYPYVGIGIHGVKEPKITCVQDNLLPPINEWIGNITGGVTDSGDNTAVGKRYTDAPYSLVVDKINADGFLGKYVNIPVEPNRMYTLAVDINVSNISGTIGAGGYYNVQFYDNSGQAIGTLANGGSFATTNGDTSMSYTATSPDNAAMLRVSLSTQSTVMGKFIFANMRVTNSETVQPFKPQSKTSLTAYTEVFSNVDGSVKDTLEYVNGKLKKVKRFEKVALDGSLAWAFNNAGVGVKRVGAIITSNWFPHTAGKGNLTKYNGKVLTLGTSVATIAPADTFTLWTDQRVYIDIANTDSGWGDSYNPTVEEIKAYFNGFIMASTLNWDAPYNNAGDKIWFRIGDSNRLNNQYYPVPKGLNTLPTWTSYNLLYQLATPVIVDVQTSGAATLELGDNHVTLASTNVPIVKASITYANSMYSALSDIERGVANLDIVGTVARKGLEVMAGRIVPRKSKGTIASANVTNSGEFGLQILSEGLWSTPNAAYVQFQRQGNFAAHFGLDVDNKLKIGGYSMGEVAYDIWHGGNNAASLAANGYQKLASGLIIQWGTVTSAPSGVTNTVTYPLAFPYTVVGITAISVGGGTAAAVAIPGITAAQLELIQSSGTNKQITWIAIGY